LAECTRIGRNKIALRAADGLVPIIKLLQDTGHERILVNVCRVIDNCASDPLCMEQVVSNDGIRLVWSMMKFDSTLVQSTAGHTLVTLLKNTKVSSRLIILNVFIFPSCRVRWLIYFIYILRIIISSLI